MGFARMQLAAAVLFLLLAATSCAKKSGSTQPAPGATEVFSSGVFSSADPVHIYVHTFSTTGNYPYHCLVHLSAMTGSVAVDPAYADSPLVTISDNVFTPGVVQVKTGSYVRWVNVGGNHGVKND